MLPAEYYARKASGWEWAPERALVFLDGAVLLVHAEPPDHGPQVAALDAPALMYARSSLVLLYGLVELTVGSGSGEIRLEYNSVVWESLRTSLLRFVAAAGGLPGPGDPAQTRAANDAIFRTLPYKFANGLQYNGLVPGERLLSAVFQPEIRERRLIVSRQVTPNTVLALTGRKVVLIEETISPALHTQPKGEHGWIFTYIPRDRVVDIDVTPGSRLSELRLSLEWGAAKERRSFHLAPETAAQFQRAWHDA